MSVSIDYESIENGIKILGPRKGKENLFYFRTVYLQDGFENLKQRFHKFNTGLPDLLHCYSGEECTITTGPQFSLLKLSDRYGLSIGVSEGRAEKTVSETNKLMKMCKIVPLSISKLSLYKWATSPLDDYMLKEYRSAAEKMQSYFKDHFSPNDDPRKIPQRLLQDREIGLLPYRAVFASPEWGFKSKGVEIFSSGMLTTNHVKHNFSFLKSMVNGIINLSSNRIEESSKVTITESKWSGHMVRSADLTVNVEEEFYEENFVSFNNKADSIKVPKFQPVSRLYDQDKLTATYHSIFFEDTKVDPNIDSHYIVSLRDKKIKISPLLQNNGIWSLSSLLYTMDGFFPILSVAAS